MGPPTEPTPRGNVTRIVEKSGWEASSELLSVRVPFSTDRYFDDVFTARRTRRGFDPVSLRETRGFIQHLFAPQLMGKNALSGLARKAFISAGALHPIDVIILSGPDVDAPILYCDRPNKFVTLKVLNPAGLEEAVTEALAIQANAKGHVILLAGDRRVVSSHYREAESLLWRDAGAALQSCSLAAHAYGYGFCPLGQLGTGALQSLGPPHEDFAALGLAVFGR